MKTIVPVLVAVSCLAHSFALAAPADHSVLADRIAKIVLKRYPDAQVTQHDGKLTAKRGTMTFTIHRHWKSGEILEKTDQVEGPNYQGFILSVSVQDGKYEGQAVVPQMIREPYWQTYIDRPPTEDGRGHYVIDFSYGSRPDKDFMKAIFEVLPKSTMPTRPSKATSDAAPSSASEAVQKPR